MKFEIKDNNGKKIVTADRLIIDFEHQAISLFDDSKNRYTEYIHVTGKTSIRSARLDDFEIEEFRDIIKDMWETEATVEEKLAISTAEDIGPIHILNLIYKYHPEYSDYVDRLYDEDEIWDLLMSLSKEAELLADEEKQTNTCN